MQNQEYENRLQDNQEALTSLNERMNDMEKREKGREELRKEQQKQEQQKFEEPCNPSQAAFGLAGTKLSDYSTELHEIKKAVFKIAESATPMKQAEEFTIIVQRVLDKLPKTIGTVTLHRFDTKAKAWIAGAFTVLLLVAVLSGITFVQWRENGKLRANDVKFRLMRQFYPMAAFWADTAYRHRPEKMAMLAEKLEAMATDSTCLKAKETKTTKINRKANPVKAQKTRQHKNQ